MLVRNLFNSIALTMNAKTLWQHMNENILVTHAGKEPIK